MNRIFYIFALLVVMVAAPVYAETAGTETVNGEAVEALEWDALMPADYFPEQSFDSSRLDSLGDDDPQAEIQLQTMMSALSSAPVVAEMHGKMVRMPGFVVPLTAEGQNVTEFFLVPYFGACIHVPPPPSNQMLHVTFEPGIKIEHLYDAIWVTGKLKVEKVAHELGTAGYKLDAFIIEPYEE
ncbi:MAG: DUF3299 domain-containing protein [Pontibacterium sp.]